MASLGDVMMDDVMSLVSVLLLMMLAFLFLSLSLLLLLLLSGEVMASVECSTVTNNNGSRTDST